ncbi:hypothetical protein EBR66_04925 [bacterium]|nr:hypothetical protein [bacterium]
METATRAVRSVLEAFSEHTNVEEALLHFVRHLEEEYEAAQDIQLFIFAIRCFLCWPRATELLEKPDTIPRIQSIWLEQNDAIYTKWLASFNDDQEVLKWSKWTFQAKTTLLAEFAKA